MWVRCTSTYSWRQAPSMTVARANAVACVFDDKIYVMGGCHADEYTNWAGFLIQRLKHGNPYQTLELSYV